MIPQARKTIQSAGTDLVVIYQLSWSNGGDCLVVRDRIRSVKDIKSVAIQLYGPHEHPAIKVLQDAGTVPGNVKFHYLPELAAPLDGPGDKIVSPPELFEAREDIDAVWVISPDAAALTEDGSAVKGAKILFTSKQASRIIPDVYAVRKDYFDANRAEVVMKRLVLVHGFDEDRLLVQGVGSSQPPALRPGENPRSRAYRGRVPRVEAILVERGGL